MIEEETKQVNEINDDFSGSYISQEDFRTDKDNDESVKKGTFSENGYVQPVNTDIVTKEENEFIRQSSAGIVPVK